MLSIHSSTIGLHLSGDDPQQQMQDHEMAARAACASGGGDVVIVVNATDNEDEDEPVAGAHPMAVPTVNDGCQLVVDIDTDADYLGESPKRGYRTDSSGEAGFNF